MSLTELQTLALKCGYPVPCRDKMPDMYNAGKDLLWLMAPEGHGWQGRDSMGEGPSRKRLLSWWHPGTRERRKDLEMQEREGARAASQVTSHSAVNSSLGWPVDEVSAAGSNHPPKACLPSQELLARHF